MDTDVEKTTHDQADKTADDRFFSAHDWFDEASHSTSRWRLTVHCKSLPGLSTVNREF
jgi:hypothetical protein